MNEVINEYDDEYDVVVDTLQKHRNRLYAMVKSNMEHDMFNVMDEIRLEQIDQLDEAIKEHKDKKDQQ